MSIKNYFGVDIPISGGPKTSFTAAAPGDSLTGTSGNDSFMGGTGNLMTGLGGDDRYTVKSAFDQVVEAAGGGVDTVKVSKLGSYVLPENVEHLSITGAAYALGNGLANIMTGQSNNQMLDGLGGNDVLIGGSGADTFQFSAASGYDVIQDFSHLDGDRIRINTDALLTWDAVQAALTQDGADVILRFDADDAVRIRNTTVASFTAADFQLRIDTSALSLTFADEFNTAPSLYDPVTHTGVWSTYFNHGSPTGPNSELSHTNNDERQVYVDPTYAGSGSTPLGLNPFSVTDGVLSIKAELTPAEDVPLLWDKTVTSGMLNTADTFHQQYGYFEMRAATPKEQGVWPAFWLLPQNQTYGLELDVMEQTGSDTTYQTSHYFLNEIKSKTNFNNPMFDVSQFHTYGMLWTAKEIAWYVDGVQVSSMATPADLNTPMYIIANMAMGGRFPGPLAADFTSAEYKIDYIRAYAVPPEAQASSINSSQGGDITDLIGDQTDNSLVGTAGADHIQGLGGNDLIDGLAGSDILDGGAGIDTVTYATADSGVRVSLLTSELQYTFGGGVDTLISIENVTGSAYDDQLTGNAAANTLVGGDGDDLLIGGEGADLLDGGAGNDTVSYLTDRGAAVVDLRILNAQNTGRDGIDTLSGIENLIGGAFNDVLTGDDGANRLDGGAANDILSGQGGDDVLIGRGGADTLTGGLGADTFVIKLTSESKGSKFDTITDFNRNEGDVIDLSAADGNARKSGNQAFTFIGDDKYDYHPTELRYAVDASGVHIYADTNGDGSSDFHIFLQGATDLLATDIIL